MQNLEDLAGNSLVLAGGFVPAAGANIEQGTHCAGIIGAVSNNRVTGSNVNAIAGVSRSSLVRLNSADFVNTLTFARNNNIFYNNMDGISFIVMQQLQPKPQNGVYRTGAFTPIIRLSDCI